MSRAALILDGHSRAALESAQSLGRASITVDVAASSAEDLALTSRYVRGRLIQPPPLPPKPWEAWIRAQDDIAQYRLIVPSTETSLLVLSRLPDGDPLKAKAVLPAADSVEIALDKERTLSLARRLGLYVPAGRLIRATEEIGPPPELPVVLKPVRSKVSIDGGIVTLAVRIARDEATRVRQLRLLLPRTAVLQQSYVGGRGIGIEVLYERGRLAWHFAHRRLHESPLFGGASTYRVSIAPPAAALEAARRLLDELQWHGVAMVEFKETAEGRFCLMEINPRLWGSLALGIDAGVDFPLGLWRLATGEGAGTQPDYRVGYATRYVPGDLSWMRENFRADRSDPLLLTQPRMRSVLEWLRPLIGRESWDHWDWRDLGVTRRMLARILDRYGEALKTAVRHRSLLRRMRSVRLKLSARRGLINKPVGSLLFLCYGNIYRSPLAEQLARRRLGGVRCESAGFHSNSGRPCPEEAIRVAAEIGVDLSACRSRCVDRAQIDRADLILAMDLGNCEQLAKQFPDALPRTTLLGLFSSRSGAVIKDPYGMDDEGIRRIYAQIAGSCEGLARCLENPVKGEA